MAAESHQRVAAEKRALSMGDLVKQAMDTPPPPLLKVHQHGFHLFGEFKRCSPSVGKLATVDKCDDAGFLRNQVAAYTLGGASAISVLTEPNEFLGSLTDLSIASEATSLPVMRKDFLVDPYQVFQTRAVGGAGLLLIVRILRDKLLAEMLAAASELGLFVLLEAFDRSDIIRASEAASRSSSVESSILIGVNARNLGSLTTDRARLGQLCDYLPPDLPRVAESSLLAPSHAVEVVEHGYDCALVGTALMRADNPAVLTASLVAAGRAASEERCASK